ncbi:hypothetical protein EVAR_51338_1 [Eumeta japonica]|uniref:Uncharacterized protein n=1 Tax=Eumeta variegata TaxID=151549 RepID=A0A4C1XZH2_EUMVA|nr:hypothetical protein EVAR_51338_1 [Eumeta japonica]
MADVTARRPHGCRRMQVREASPSDGKAATGGTRMRRRHRVVRNSNLPEKERERIRTPDEDRKRKNKDTW